MNKLNKLNKSLTIKGWTGRLFSLYNARQHYDIVAYQKRRDLIPLGKLIAGTEGMILQLYRLGLWDSDKARYCKCMLEDTAMCIIFIHKEELI